MTDITVWQLALGLALVVALVVVALLTAILVTARRIRGVAGSIWTAGGNIAANTVHVPELAHTNVHVEKILAAAPALVAALERIRAHAARCPGCPACLLSGARS